MTAWPPHPEPREAETAEIVTLHRSRKRREGSGCRDRQGAAMRQPAPGTAGHCRHGNRPSTELAFLVDDGVAFPPELGHAGRQRLPVRNRIERTAAHRRLAEKTGELGRIQI